MSLIHHKKLIILMFTFSIYGCFDHSQAKQIGDSNICIPNQFVLNLGSDDNDEIYDETPSVYEGVSIDASHIQQNIPEYQGTFGQGNDKIYAPLSITITQYKSNNRRVPEASEYDYFFSKASPNLVGYRNEWPYVNWSTFEIQPNQSRVYWGECTDYSSESNKKPVNCDRVLRVGEFNFEYSVSRSNIDLYPKIDTYIKNKVAEEWHCD